ncbi:hypothetical protein H5410_030082, partial [Solanum commersonii]
KNGVQFSVIIHKFGNRILTLISVLKRSNGWFFTMKFSSKKCELPPGDMGWPLVGNMLFFQSFKDGNLGSFVSYFVTRFGEGGMCKACMFGKPSIIITKVETSRKIFMDDDNFDRGMPKYILKILGQVQVGGFTKEESKRLHRLTTPIKSDISLSSNYFDFANEIVKNSFEKLVAMEEPIDILLAMKRPTFEVLMRILIGDGVDHDLVDVLFEETIYLIRGCHGLPSNIPGSSYNRGLKEEQEDIVKRRSSSNEGLNFHEIKQMKYLSNVINELRIAMAKTIFFREARTTIKINGYTIPKGWKFLTFSWNYHLDPNTYVRPKKFNPSRWDDLEPKPASFLPFGVGPKMCPGTNLARLEVSVILHYFLLHYRYSSFIT